MPEVVTSNDFESALVSGELAMTLVGMSNVGKSYWSERLADDAGFEDICCDDLIEADIEHILKEGGYSGGIADVARWMGQPYDPQFAEAEKTYLDLESEHLKRIIDGLEEFGPLGGNRVIDTTGSVVHTSPLICEKLGQLTTIVALEATPDMQQEMFELYIAEPKPVVWGDVFEQQDNESPEQALARCYPNLLERRSRLYAEMAHVIIPREVSVRLGDAGGFLDYVIDTLPT